jgi:PAS domain S-box-containing protein
VAGPRLAAPPAPPPAPRSPGPATLFGLRMAGADRAPERATVYWILVLVLAGGAILLRQSPWRTGATLHTTMEVIATTLAFIISALSLVRYYSRKQSTFLFIGTGFLGTALLELNHAIVTSPFYAAREGVQPQDLSAWSWTSARLYLSLYLFVSLLAWWRETREQEVEHVNEHIVYATATLLAVTMFFFFRLVPLSAAYRPGMVFSRPGEFGPALFFALAFAGYLWKGNWRTLAFEHWLLISLLISVVLHGLYMSRSQTPFDATYDAAHLLKIASYLAVMNGLMISVYHTFRRETDSLETVRDINAQLAREITTRRETEGRLQHFLDTANDLIQSVAPDGRFLYVNRAWQETLGYTDHDLEKQGLFDILHPDNRDKAIADFKRLLDGERMDRMLVGFVARDGRQVLCEGSANLLMRDGRPVATQAIFRDVTEQRRAERELAASRANLAALVENTGDTIWSVDRQERLITFNSAFALAVEARTGREPKVGMVPTEVFLSEDVPFYQEIYSRTLSGERLSELREENTQGQQQWFEIYCHPITDGSGVTGAVMFGKDVSRRIMAEEGMRLAKEDAEAANQAKSQFLANMSHELRTPLNSIIGFANIVLKNKKGHLDQQESGYLSRIVVNGRHLLSLINEILDLAKIEAGRMELEIMQTDVGALVRETIQGLEGQVKDKDVKLLADVPEKVLPVETDPHKLKQVIINLVGNALKFTEHGSVTARVQTDRDGTPLAIRVVDTGIGIPRNRLEAIFEAFQQADGSTTRKFGGTGLGLTISRSMCQLMGYDLTVDSEEGKGSVFSIVMAAHRQEGKGEQPPPKPSEVAKEPPAPSPVGSLRDFRVLVVDDENDARVLMQHYLEDFGCSVLTATNAEEGIAMARREHPDLITLDLMMPGMNGWDALKVLKNDPEVRNIPVVVVSILAGEGRGKLLGAVDLVTKPVEREDLLRVLWRNLVRRQGARVLVVDDDAATRDGLSAHLKEVGLEVQLAENGQDALEQVQNEAPDAVVLDLLMPVMDGMTFLDRLRASPYHRGLPVIVMTAKELTAREREELTEKASGVIAKGDGLEDRLVEVLGTLFPLGTPQR